MSCYEPCSVSYFCPINAILKNRPRLLVFSSVSVWFLCMHLWFYNIYEHAIFYLSILLINLTLHLKKKPPQVFFDLSPWGQEREFPWESLGLLGVHRRNLTECCPAALQNGPPTTDQEGSSLFTQTCLLLLIFHMLFSVRCHLIIALINISLITTDIKHFFTRLSDLEFSCLWNCVQLLYICLVGHMSFSWGFPASFSTVNMNSF